MFTSKFGGNIPSQLRTLAGFAEDLVFIPCNQAAT